MDNSTKKEDDSQGENLQLLREQQRWLLQRSNLKAPEERPYRRRIKPPPAKVHHVHPARFRRFVQRRTCGSMLPQPNAPPCASNNSDDATTASAAASATANLLQTPPDVAAIGDGDAATGSGCLNVTRRSMQEAYMAWCSSNDILLSPGTMAELSFTEHPLQ
ncbi:hypothetical protein HU200_042051 [Digitaria exilis]|uniref:Uncharacterized protein n=1 Tax=Digitaria exilis TaxID=1010633 RepID=A0A835B6S3_9POAL|nr:hypothetical protein HU200_042051 [Digitaria exilis]CAB3495111.1 unnamed protein product [Digitaria exilis]